MFIHDHSSSSFRAGTNTSTSTVSQHHVKAPIGTIVGGTIGGLGGLSLLVGLFYAFRRRRFSSRYEAGRGHTTMLQRPETVTTIPARGEITPFLQTDSSRAPTTDSGSMSPNRGLTAVENKRALGLRRAQLSEERRVTVMSGPPSTSPSSASRTTRSERSNRSHTEALLREITSLRREITAIRAPADNVSESAPPEYDDA